MPQDLVVEPVLPPAEGLETCGALEERFEYCAGLTFRVLFPSVEALARLDDEASDSHQSERMRHFHACGGSKVALVKPLNDEFAKCDPVAGRFHFAVAWHGYGLGELGCVISQRDLLQMPHESS